MASIGSTTLRYATTLQRDSEGSEFPFSPSSCRYSPREFARTYSVIRYPTYMIYKNFRRKIQCPPPGFFLTKSLRHPRARKTRGQESEFILRVRCRRRLGADAERSLFVLSCIGFSSISSRKRQQGGKKCMKKRRHFYLSLLVLYT